MSAFQLYPLTSVGALGVAEPAAAAVLLGVTGWSLWDGGLSIVAKAFVRKKPPPGWADDQRAGTRRACSILGVQGAREKSLESGVSG